MLRKHKRMLNIFSMVYHISMHHGCFYHGENYLFSTFVIVNFFRFLYVGPTFYMLTRYIRLIQNKQNSTFFTWKLIFFMHDFTMISCIYTHQIFSITLDRIFTTFNINSCGTHPRRTMPICFKVPHHVGGFPV